MTPSEDLYQLFCVCVAELSVCLTLSHHDIFACLRNRVGLLRTGSWANLLHASSLCIACKKVRGSFPSGPNTHLMLFKTYTKNPLLFNTFLCFSKCSPSGSMLLLLWPVFRSNACVHCTVRIHSTSK